MRKKGGARKAGEGLSAEDFFTPIPEAMQMPVSDAESPERKAVVAAVAANPSYAALSFSRLLSSGAPLVSCGRVEGRLLGREDFLMTPGGERIPVRYAAAEADRLISQPLSDDLFSPGRPSSEEDAPFLVVSGYLRAVGIGEAYRAGNAGGYRARLLADCALLEISEKAVRRMREPVLVRLMPSGRVSPALSALGNELPFRVEVPEEPKQRKAAIPRQAELLPEAPPPAPIPVLWLEEDGRPALASLLEFVRRRPLAEQEKLLDERGLPKREVLPAFRRAELLSVFGEAALPLLDGAEGDAALARVADAMMAAAPLASVLERAGCRAVSGLLAEAAGYAAACRAQGLPLEVALRQGDLTVSPAALCWLFLAAAADASGWAEFMAFARGLETAAGRRSTRRARQALASDLARSFEAWLAAAVPIRMEGYYHRK